MSRGNQGRRVPGAELLLLLVLMGGVLRPAAAQDPEFGGHEAEAPAVEPEAPHGQSWSGVTVRTTDGWKIPVATVFWVPGAEVPLLRVQLADGTYKDWDAYRIADIRNSLGVDITREVAAALPGFTDDQQMRWESPYTEVGEPVSEDYPHKRLGDMAFEGLFNAAFGLHASYSTAWGMWYEGVQNGPGLLANLRGRIHRRTYLGLSVHHRWLGAEDFYLANPYDDSVHLARADYRQTSLFLVLGTHGRRLGSHGGCFFWEVGVGWASHQVKVTVQGETASASVGKAGFLTNLGYWAPLGENSLLEIGVSLESKDSVIFHRSEPGGSLLSGYLGLVLH